MAAALLRQGALRVVNRGRRRSKRVSQEELCCLVELYFHEQQGSFPVGVGAGSPSLFVAAFRFVSFHFIRCIALQAGWGALKS
jgi:hypothetical protein